MLISMILAACSTSHSTPVPPADPGPAPVPPVPADSGVDLASADRVVYRFRDASVPPPDHRSFTLTLTPTEAHRVVDSYGDVVSDETRPLDRPRFDALVAGLSGIATVTDAPVPGCTGGTGLTLTVSAGATTLLEGSQERCAGEQTGTLSGDVRAWAREATAMFR